MNHRASLMSMPPPSYGAPPPGYGAPPPGYGPPVPPKNNTTKIVLIVLAVLLALAIPFIAIVAAILFPVFAKVRGNARLASCQSNMKQIGLGLLQYELDNNNKLPASAAAYKDTIFPYVKSESVFRCPADQSGGVDYSMNTNLQGVSVDKISDPTNTVAIYEGTGQTLNFRHEHIGGEVAVVCFADGHVREVSQKQVGSLRWKP